MNWFGQQFANLQALQAVSGEHANLTRCKAKALQTKTDQSPYAEERFRKRKLQTTHTHLCKQKIAYSRLPLRKVNSNFGFHFFEQVIGRLPRRSGFIFFGFQQKKKMGVVLEISPRQAMTLRWPRDTLPMGVDCLIGQQHPPERGDGSRHWHTANKPHAIPLPSYSQKRKLFNLTFTQSSRAALKAIKGCPRPAGRSLETPDLLDRRFDSNKDGWVRLVLLLLLVSDLSIDPDRLGHQAKKRNLSLSWLMS